MTLSGPRSRFGIRILKGFRQDNTHPRTNFKADFIQNGGLTQRKWWGFRTDIVGVFPCMTRRSAFFFFILSPLWCDVIYYYCCSLATFSEPPPPTRSTRSRSARGLLACLHVKQSPRRLAGCHRFNTLTLNYTLIWSPDTRHASSSLNIKPRFHAKRKRDKTTKTSQTKTRSFKNKMYTKSQC